MAIPTITIANNTTCRARVLIIWSIFGDIWSVGQHTGRGKRGYYLPVGGLFQLQCGGAHRGDGHYVDDVFGGGAAGEIHTRLGQALDQGAVGVAAG